ncbi:hypothetical protein [Mesorhizobium sp. f-mel]
MNYPSWSFLLPIEKPLHSVEEHTAPCGLAIEMHEVRGVRDV